MLLDPGSTCRSGKMLRRNFAYEIWRHFLFLRERWCHSCWLLIRTEWERRYRNVKRVTSSGLMLESYLYTLLKPILFQIINLMLCKINWLYWSTHTFPPGFLFHSFVVCLVAESPTLAHCSSYHGNSQTFPLRSRFWFTSCVSLSLCHCPGASLYLRLFQQWLWTSHRSVTSLLFYSLWSCSLRGSRALGQFWLFWLIINQWTWCSHMSISK